MCLSKISMGEPVTHTRTVIAHFWKGLSVLCPGTRKTNRIICYNLIVSYAHLKDGVGLFEHSQGAGTPTGRSPSVGAVKKAGTCYTHQVPVKSSEPEDNEKE